MKDPHRIDYPAFKEVALHVGHKVLKKVDDNSVPIVGDPQWILGQQLRHHPIHVLNIIIILFNGVELYF